MQFMNLFTNMIYKTFKEIPHIEKQMFIKAFINMKTKSYYTPEDIVHIDAFVIKDHVDKKTFCFNYTSKKYKQSVQSTGIKILKRDLDKLILNNKLKKISIN